MYNKCVISCVVLVLIVGVIGDEDLQTAFTQWAHTHGKTYSAADFIQRYTIFKNRHQAILNHNANPDYTFKKALNAFSDLTDEEFSRTHYGYSAPNRASREIEQEEEREEVEIEGRSKRACASGSATCGSSCCSTAANYGCVSGRCYSCAANYTFCGMGCCPSGYSCSSTKKCINCGGKPADSSGCQGAQIPTDGIYTPTVNWTARGYSTQVKDQGQCGDCWAFSTTGVIEGAHNIKHLLTGSSQVVLSEQNILDCAESNYGYSNNHGCNGGWMGDALQYVKNNGGIDSAASYPYTAAVGTTCKYSASNKAASIVSYATISGEAALQTQVDKQPVSIAMMASPALQGYSNGIFNDPACGTGSGASLNHAVLVVGYGTHSTAGAYWICKNQWGANWGMGGYFLLQKGLGRCGVGQSSFYTTAA